MREPLIAWWPGTIKGGNVCSQVVTSMDILPSVSNLIYAPLPGNKIDGRDKSSLFFSPEKELK